MGNTTISPNMGLVVPTVGVDPGPDWGNNLNASLIIVDGHNHSPGQGIQITPAGMSINSDLPFGNNNAINLRSVRFQVQGSAISGAADLGCLYLTGADLWFNDENGNQIQMTAGGTVNATSSGISSGSATASFVGGVLVVNAAANTPANIQGASLLLGNNVASSKYLTLSPPNSMVANYQLNLPNLPSSTSFLTLDTSGNIVGSIPTNQGITGSNLAGNTIDGSKIVAGFGLNPTGTILSFGGISLPTGYLWCDGSAISRATFSNLFSVIGTAFGSGNGSTTFNTPISQGFFFRGTNTINGISFGVDPNASSRTALQPGGNTGDNVGSVQGDATDVNGLNISDPGHIHSFPEDNGGGVGPRIPASTLSSIPINTNTNSAVTGISVISNDAETRPVNIYVNYIIKT